jgi:hypothetical protein
VLPQAQAMDMEFRNIKNRLRWYRLFVEIYRVFDATYNITNIQDGKIEVDIKIAGGRGWHYLIL